MSNLSHEPAAGVVSNLDEGSERCGARRHALREVANARVVGFDAVVDAGGELLQRKDDNEETIGQRLTVYREQTEPVISFYRQRDKLQTVEAEGSVDEVYARLLSVLE